jgi:hypothetical protein
MSKALSVNGVELQAIRNKNESRVAAIMAKVFCERAGYSPDVLDVQDIYALALNMLPPRYVQRGTIVLNEPVDDRQIEECIAKAIKVVTWRPNY